MMFNKSKKHICPVCGKPYEFALKTWQDENGEWHCEHDNPSGLHSKKSKARRENEEASALALKLAAEARARDAIENPMVTVNPPKGSKGKPMKVPKKVVESIEEKVAPELDKLPD